MLYQHTKSPTLFFAYHETAGESLGVLGGGIDPHELQRFHQHFAEINPWAIYNKIIPVGVVGNSEQALSRRNLVKTEFYNDWMRRQDDIIGGTALICHRDGEKFSAITLNCPVNQYDHMNPYNLGFLNDLAPHLARCIEMSKLLANDHGDKYWHLDCAGQAVFLISKSGRIGHANRAAEQLLSSDDPILQSSRDSMVSSNDNLRGFIKTAISAMRKSTFQSLPSPLPVVFRNFGTCLFHAHVFPEAAGPQFPASVWSDPIAGAIIVAGCSGFNQVPDYHGIVTAFGATGAEARLAQAIMEGQSLYDYADEYKLSRYTVRNQMRALRQKSRTNDKTAFVRMMLKLASPFQQIHHD